jgi:citrate synthase
MDENKDVGFKKGLEGIIAGDSKVCLVDGTGGRLYYRGYAIKDLAENCSFEEVAYLLLYQKLPTSKELKEFRKKLAARRSLPKHVVKVIKDMPSATNPAEALRTGASSLGSGIADASKLTAEGQTDHGIALIAAFPVISAYFYRLSHGLKIVKPDKKLGHAENYLYMLRGTVPDAEEARALDMDMVLHAEHSFNASTFAVRITISTLSDMYSALTTGVGVLKGPLHGGAATAVAEMLKEVGSVSNVDKYVSDTLARHGKIMGVGHRVYRTYDPRAVILKNEARRLSEKKHDTRWFEIADRIEGRMLAEKGLHTNVDFYSSIVYGNLGLEPGLYSDIFAIARTAGWVAHALEQYGDNRLIRPLDNYTGQVDMPFVPIKDRK